MPLIGGCESWLRSKAARAACSNSGRSGKPVAKGFRVKGLEVSWLEVLVLCVFVYVRGWGCGACSCVRSSAAAIQCTFLPFTDTWYDFLPWGYAHNLFVRQKLV